MSDTTEGKPRRRRVTEPVETPEASKPAKKKKKLSKKQRHVRAHQPDQLPTTTAGYMAQMMKDIRVETGDPTMALLSDAGEFLIGIPLPSFACEYICCNNILPLEKLIQVYGPPGIGKSGFAFEIMRWFRKKSGVGNLLEHETKYNPDWAASIIGWEDTKSVGIIPCDSIDDWQTYCQKNWNSIKAIMNGDSKRMGAGKTFPYLQIVDSIMGKSLKETQDKIAKAGFAGRGFAVEALSITRWLQCTPQIMRRWPFTLVTVNHQKVGTSDQGMPSQTRSGGQSVNFQGAYEFELRRIKRIRTQSATGYNGHTLRIKVCKNGYGEDNRHCMVNVVWRDEEVEIHGEKVMKQKTFFDWHGATTALLLNSEGAIWTDARKLCGSLVKDSTTKCHAKGLGFPPGKKVEYHVAGAAIARNPEMMKGLRKMFGVQMRKVFRTDMDYTDQLKVLKRKLAAKEDS